MVECDLAKVEVAGSNPVSRSSFGFGFSVDRVSDLHTLQVHGAPVQRTSFRCRTATRSPRIHAPVPASERSTFARGPAMGDLAGPVPIAQAYARHKS